MPRSKRPTSGLWASQTRVVDIDEAHHVVLRKPTYGDQQEAMSASSRLEMNTGAVTIDYARLRMEQLVHCVVSWSGPDFDGVEPSRENVLALPSWIGSRLSAELQTLMNEDLTPENEGDESIEKK